MFSSANIKKTVLAAVAGAAICVACPTPGHADWDHDRWHHDHDRAGVVVAIPGLSIALGDNDFAHRWDRSDYYARARFCHDVRHDCYEEGRYSRACHLKWRYCSPGQRDYGFYYNH